MCFAPQRRALFQHPNLQKWHEHVVFCTFWHNGVHFFDISTSKSRPTLRCFAHFDFQMYFAPQRRALFQHLNFQKWSQRGVLCTFWLGNVLRATTACTFSTSQLPKVVRRWGILSSLTWKCASRHNGVQFFIDGSAPAALASLLFDPPKPQIIGKTQWIALSYLFAHLHLLSSDSFSSDLLSSNLSLLSASALLCVSSVHIVGSLTSKLPSIIVIIIINNNNNTNNNNNVYIFSTLLQSPMSSTSLRTAAPPLCWISVWKGCIK